MNNLIAFFKQNFHYLLFFILQVIAIVLIYTNMNYARFVLGTHSKAVIGPVYNGWHSFVKHFSLESENEALILQNEQLMRAMPENFITTDDSTYSVEGKEGRGRRARTVKMYEYMHAHVIHNTIHKKNNYLLLDKGRADGIDVDMAVISPEGVVGVVNDVSEHFSSAISLLHPDSRISARILPVNQVGTVLWDEIDAEHAYLQDIPQHWPVSVGDTVVTSGFSNVYPKDIMVGIVSEASKDAHSNFYTLKIQLSTNFSRLNTVYVVKNLYKSELDTLKKNFKDE